MMIPGEWTRTRPPSRCLSDLALDQLAAGEDPGPLVLEAWRAHLRQCAACEWRRAEFGAHRAALLARRPALALPFGDAAGRRLRPVWGAGVLVAAAAALVVAFRAPAPPATPARRLKGGFGLEVFVKRAAGGVEALLPDAAASPGDALRFRVSTETAGLVTILGVDAAGVSSYDPVPSALPMLAAGQQKLLDGSIVLDGTVGHERLFALLCPERDQMEAAIGEVKRALTMALDSAPATPPGCRQTIFPFQKVARP